MHIGIDARLTYYRAGGISTYIRNLIRELERLDQQNTYTVLHSRKAAKTLSGQFRRANLWTPCHHRIERAALAVELPRLGLDVLHSPDFIPPRGGARRYVITVHDLSFLHYPQFMTTESRRYYKDQIHAAVQKASQILTISKASRNDIVNMLDVPPEKIWVHYLGTDHTFTPQPPEAVADMRRQLDLPESYLLFVGTFEPRKNIIGLLQAYREVLHQYPDAPVLVLAGTPGWQFDDTMQKIEAMHLSSHILWRRKIPQSLLPALYTGALVHTMPSFYEGFGLPALEAMSCGTMSIVSDRSSLPEVVGNTGLQVDPDKPPALAAALIKAITDTEWRHAQEKAALERAARFTWTDSAQVALMAYRSAVE